MTVMRVLISALLAVSLTVTSLSAGMARGQAAPAGMVEICQGLTTVSVMLDVDGNPVSHVHLCPDGVMSLMVPLLAQAPLLAPLAVWRPLSPVCVSRVRAGRDAPLGQARGPPLFL